MPPCMRKASNIAFPPSPFWFELRRKCLYKIKCHTPPSLSAAVATPITVPSPFTHIRESFWPRALFPFYGDGDFLEIFRKPCVGRRMKMIMECVQVLPNHEKNSL